MPSRLVSLALFLLAVPAVCQQQTNIQTRISQRVAAREDSISRVSAAPPVDQKAMRMAVFHHDVSELSALSTSVQSDLQLLQKGVLTKDLNQNLKKLEKLSKKVRREME